MLGRIDAASNLSADAGRSWAALATAAARARAAATNSRRRWVIVASRLSSSDELTALEYVWMRFRIPKSPASAVTELTRDGEYVVLETVFSVNSQAVTLHERVPLIPGLDLPIQVMLRV